MATLNVATAQHVVGPSNDETNNNNKNNKKRKMMIFPSLPPPSHYERLYSSYQLEWEARKRLFPLPIEVTSLCFVPTNNKEDHNVLLLLVGTNLGTIMVYRQQQREQEDDGDGDDDKEWIYQGERKLGGTNPTILESSSHSEITFLHATTNNNKLMIVAASRRHGLYWWSNIHEMMNENDQNSENNTTIEIVQATAVPSNNNNDDDENLRIFVSTPNPQKLIQVDLSFVPSASSKKKKKNIQMTEIDLLTADDNNDNIGCGEITTLHVTCATTVTPQYSSTQQQQQQDDQWLLIGTDQSKVHCWNVHKETMLEPLLLQQQDKTMMMMDSTSTFNNKNKNKTTIMKRVTAIASIHSDWWIIAGQYYHPTTTKATTTGRFGSGSSGGGNSSFISTWHGPTQTMIRIVEHRRETIQGLLLIPSYNDMLYSIGNENVLTVWDSPLMGSTTTTSTTPTVLNRIQTSAPSNRVLVATTATATTTNTANNNNNNNNGMMMIAVAGVGSKIDLIQRQVCFHSLDLLKSSQSDDL